MSTRSNFEARVSDALRAAGIGEFAPEYSETVRWSDRVKVTTRPLFPGYLFAKFSRREEANAVLSVTGVIHILGNNEFDSISDETVETLQRFVESPLPVLPCAYVAVGSPARVKCGPFADCVGVIVRTKGSVRLVVSIPMLGRSCSVELDVADVEAVKP